MNGELAQAVALVAHGNLFLARGADADAPDLLRTNSTFRYVSSVTFARYRSRDERSGTLAAADVPAWFRFLRADGVRRLWHVAFAWERRDAREYQMAGFAGAVPVAIQGDAAGAFELWYPASRYEKGAEGAPWAVEYRSLVFDESHALQPDLGAVKSRLAAALLRAERFARAAGEATLVWAEWFSKALALLEDASPATPFHPDILPPEGYGLEARQLMAAAAQAYVFGGMGSWNDVWLKDEGARREYDDVTAELYDAVKLATVAAPNSFTP